MQSANQQVILKPKDLVVLLKLGMQKERSFTYASLALDLAISASEMHASLQRAHAARLISTIEPSGAVVIREALREFTIHGVKYAFPGIMGPISRGIPTSYAGPSLRSLITQSEEMVPVWPYANGNVRGVALYPLYPAVPTACERDPELYDALTLVDAIRAGAARERELAIALLMKKLS